MKPIAIFRHAAIEGPGYLAEFLDARKIPWQLICIDAGEEVPGSASDYSGLAFMGGPMSVNDDLPWIPRVEKLICDAVTKDVPLLGHCLGGQLMSKALGGRVARNPVKEIGWGEVVVSDNETARSWFGEVRGFNAFHWHGETFTLPPEAVHLLSSAHCRNQAWGLGKNLALQCHVEMTADMITSWCKAGADEVTACGGIPSVQSVRDIQIQAGNMIREMRTVADRLYEEWLSRMTHAR